MTAVDEDKVEGTGLHRRQDDVRALDNEVYAVHRDLVVGAELPDHVH